MREEREREARDARDASLRRSPLADTASRRHTTITAPLAQIRTMVNMRSGPLPELDDLAISIKETGLLHPPLVRASDDEERPYELLAGRRRFSAMGLIDGVDGARDDWRFTLVDGISRREALTMQFAENFHQSKPEPVQFARAARAIMAEDEELTAADVSRMVGAPATWTRKALHLLDLPESIVERVEQGDLSFTMADVVRRGIARGDVSAEDAEELVEQHAAGEITGGSLKLGVGYVPPKPKNYEELSRDLDKARWAGGSGDVAADAEQRDWESSGPRPEPRRVAPPAVSTTPGAPAPALPAVDVAVTADELDAYALTLLLARIATPEQRGALGLVDLSAVQEYAFSLPPHERLGVLRSMAGELLIADREPPRELRGKVVA